MKMYNLEVIIKNKLVLLSKKFNLDLLILFGSRVKKTNLKNSDYDIAIYSKKNISKKNYFEIFEEVREIFKEKKFDLVLIDEQISQVLAKEIFFKGVCLYEKSKGLFNLKKENIYFSYIDSIAILEPNKLKFLEI